MTAGELVEGVEIALQPATPDTCLPFDSNRDGSVTVDELVKAAKHVVIGCPS